MIALGDEVVKIEAEEIIAERIKLNPWSIKKNTGTGFKSLTPNK